MKILTHDSAQLSRVLLLVAAVVSIPLLFIATVFETAGGGTQKLQYLLLPFISILLYFCYVLYKRRSDKEKYLRSSLILIISELIIALTALTMGCLAMYAMISWNFELAAFIVLTSLICLSLILLFDSLKDLKKNKRTAE